MDPETESAALERKFIAYRKYGAKFGKAVDAVAAGAVKEHRFLPSGRTLYTVVGNLGEEFVNPQKPYCSCSDFFFRVLTKRDETCYHLLGYRMAFETRRFDTTRFADAEYPQILRAIMGDVYRVIEQSAL